MQDAASAGLLGNESQSLFKTTSKLALFQKLAKLVVNMTQIGRDWLQKQLVK
jgi:hypothetical protein